MSIVPQLVARLTTYRFAGSSASIGLGMRCAPFGTGERADTQLPEDDPEPGFVVADACSADVLTAIARVPRPVDPHAAKTSPRPTAAAQHRARRAALGRTNIGAA